jgi:zinc and cadmium transporter
MSAIALTGSLVLVLKESTLNKILMPLVAFASGYLIGGAFFHLIPGALQQMSNISFVFLSVSLGFVALVVLEQFMHWHHCHLKLAGRWDPTISSWL